jgi:hypothetical protein
MNLDQANRLHLPTAQALIMPSLVRHWFIRDKEIRLTHGLI